ncbi:MAG: hypothetical protein K0U16_07430 [Gammaproteobacteria bacterium]|nr:hypothetical protein [Gammaproteobacteria bacterium]
MVNAFWLRRFLAMMAQAGQIIEQLPEPAANHPEYFDNRRGIGPVERKLFYKHRSGILLPFKGSPKEIPIEKRIGVCAHITAIAFGTTARKRKFWRKLIEDGTIDDVTWKLYGETPEAAAERMALHARFWVVPYHWVGLLNGDVLFNNDFTRYTYHGNGANPFHIGVAAEANLPGLEKNRTKRYHEMTEQRILTWRAALRLAVVKGREAGAPIEELTHHRRYSKGRIGDPGEGWWKEVGIPIAAELDLVIVFDNRNLFGGYDLCQEWDERGLVDYRGRPVRVRQAA